MLTRVKSLFSSVAVYGLGDVATSVVSLLLLPVFTTYLTPADYGIITMLLIIEAVTKVLFRWGVDTAFMRLYYDCADQPSRQRLASTIFFFLFTVNGVLLAGALTFAGSLSQALFETRDHSLLISLTLVNMFVAGFYFIPFQVLRIQERSRQFIALSFARSAGTIVARLLLVIWAGMGVVGIVVADVMVTVIFTVILARWLVPLIRPVFSRAILTDALGFGLPRVPHSVAHLMMGFWDRYFLSAHTSLRDVGLYSIGATFGLTLKFFLGAFESAWTPFFLGLMKEVDAPQIYSRVSTYVLAVLVALVAAVCAMAPGVVRLFTTAEFHSAAAVTPWIALGVMFQGLYLVGSIGLVITKRTTLYPLTTGAAAGVSVLANVLLIPKYGILGAAWANTIAYATLAVVTVGCSLYVYPIRYEWNRLLRIVVAGAASYIVATWVVREDVAALIGILLAGLVATATFAIVLFSSGFFRSGELRIVRELWHRRGRTKAALRQRDAMPAEMAGDLIDLGPDPPAADDGPESSTKPTDVSPRSRFPRR